MSTSGPSVEPWTHHDCHVNGIRLHYVSAGAGPLVVLLHGFPEFWYSWRKQIPILAAAGFRIVAPDLRGYNDSDKPAGIEPYRLEVLVEDMVGLIAHLGAASATVIGHDWGGIVAWEVALRAPSRVNKLIVLNAPHPMAFARELQQPRQFLLSWYIFFFQLPWLPEFFLRRANYAGLERMLREEPVHPGAFTEEDIQRYKAALNKPGALTAALHYYRAGFRHPQPPERWDRGLEVPTLILWGKRDRYLSTRLLMGLRTWVKELRIRRFPQASHWLANDAPEQVNACILEYLLEPAHA